MRRKNHDKLIRQLKVNFKAKGNFTIMIHEKENKVSVIFARYVTRFSAFMFTFRSIR